MATDEERLILRLEAQTSKFEKQLAKAQKSTNRRAKAIENRFSKLNRNITGSLSRSLRGALPAVGVGLLAREFKQLADANTRIQNALKVTGLEGDGLQTVFDNLFASAQKNFVPFEALSGLYSKVALVQKELGVSTAELTGFTENVALALRVSGKSATESSGALLQLSQALGSGVVRAEEFNSILEGAPTIAQAVAAGLREAGGSVAALRTLVIDGKISSEAFFRAFEAGAPSLASKVASAEVTTSQALTRLQNELIKVAGEFDESTGSTKSFVAGIEGLTSTLGPIATWSASAVGYLGSFGAAVQSANQSVTNLARNLLELSGAQDFLSKTGAGLNSAFEKGGSFIGSRLNAPENAKLLSTLKSASGFNYFKSISGDVKKLTGDIVNLTKESEAFGDGFDPRNLSTDGFSVTTQQSTEVKPVSLKSFAVAAKPSKAKKKSGSKKVPKTPGQNFADDLDAIQRRTALIEAQTAAQDQLNPLIDDYGFAVEKARIKQDLLNKAKEAGVRITPELERKIDALATQYAVATSQAAKLAEEQDNLRQKAEEFKDLGQDVVKGFISDLKNGKSAAEALSGALDKIADKLLDMAINDLFSGSAGGGGGGLFGNLLGGLFGGIPGFARGTDSAPGGLAVVGEKGPELVNLRKGAQVIPNHKLGGGNMHITVGVSADSNGNLLPFVESVTERQLQRAAPSIVNGSVKAVRGQMGALLSNQQRRSG